MNDKYFVDLHIHSQASDGTRTPEEIAKLAASKGVNLLAVADHNTLAAQAEVAAQCARLHIRAIPAVELDTLSGDAPLHILAYDFDLNDEAFRAFVSHARFALDEVSVRLVEKMEKDFDAIDFRSYTEFPDCAGLGGWKALHYLVEKGAATSIWDALRFYGEYGMDYAKSGFPTVQTACDRIRRAGGFSVLAHPGEMIDTSSIEGFKEALRELVRQGVEGVECYYPSHTEEVTQACLEICEEKSLFITSGADDHGSFGKKEIGQMGVTIDQLRLRELRNTQRI